jgi:hypothetical protein
MSSDVVYNCATCSKTVKGKQHYAICVSCSRRVHRKCYGDGLSHIQWNTIRRNFTCAACEGQRLNSNYCSDVERQLVIEGTTEQMHHVSTYVPPTTIKYEIIFGASQKGGDVVSDGCGYTYSFYTDYQGSRVWRCTYRGCVEFPRCYSTLKQVKRAEIDSLRTYSQEDFTLEKAHSHPPNYEREKRQLIFHQENISTSESARISANVGVSIDYQGTHISNSGVATAKRKRCPGRAQANKKKCWFS